MRSYIKIFGPHVLKAIRTLERIAVDMPDVCIMDTIILRDIPRSLARDIGGYFDSGGITVPVERCKNIISNSGEMLGEYDFFFEWFEKPGLEQLYNLIERLDEELAPLGCYYTITTKS